MSSKRRTDSPGAKSTAKAGSKSPTSSAASLAPKPAVPAKKEPALICGFHPEVFHAVILGPLVIAIIIGAAVFFDVGKTVVVFVDAQWAIYSRPVGKFLATNADAIVVLAAAGAMAPFVVVMTVQTWGAAMDLGHFPLWAQATLLALVTCAVVATVVTQPQILIKVFATVQTQWNKVSDPIEDILKHKADAIIAGVAICCMLPIAAAIVSYVVRAIWGCRVKIIVEEDKK